MNIDVAALTLKNSEVSEKRKPLPKPAKGEKFLKGPIPLGWLFKAGQQPGHALHVANALWFIGGIEKNAIVKLPAGKLREMGVGRHAMYRGLAALEAAGLVRVVTRHRGRSPVVEILKIADTIAHSITKSRLDKESEKRE